MAKPAGQPAAPRVKSEPAAKGQPAVKPAAKKPAVVEGIGINELAADLNRTPKSVRASIRRVKGGAQVGQGGRYRWTSKSDPEYKSLLKELSAVKTSEETVDA